MADTSERIRREIEDTRAELGNRLEQLATRAEQAVDVRHHVRTRPWTAVAAAATVGFLVGRARNGTSPRGAASGNGAPAPAPRGRSSLGTWMADELDLLATAAGKTLLAVLLDTVRRDTPPLVAYLDQVVEEHARRR